MSNSNQVSELSNPNFEKFERGEMPNPNQVREFQKPNQASAF